MTCKTCSMLLDAIGQTLSPSERNNEVAGEAKRKAAMDFLVSNVVKSFELYTPPPESESCRIWPAAAALRYCGLATSPKTIHYGRKEFSALVRRIIGLGISREQIVISS